VHTGQTLYVHAVANLANNAQSRYDIGVWVSDPTDKSAMSAMLVRSGLLRTMPATPCRGRVRRIELGARCLAGCLRRHVAGHRVGTLDLEVLQVTCKANAARSRSIVHRLARTRMIHRPWILPYYPPVGAQGFRLEPFPNGVEGNCEPFTLRSTCRRL
jgi:hypothetical protein